MKPRLPIPVSHTRCPLQIRRDTLALVIALAFAAGVTVAVWFILLVKGGAL
jgi:hypothetical protein